MRKQITLVGIGERRQGVSKATNKPYDFTPVSFTFEDGLFRGVRAVTVNVVPDVFPPELMEVGGHYDAVLHNSNYQIYLDAVIV